jgi:hypothetical protein
MRQAQARPALGEDLIGRLIKRPYDQDEAGLHAWSPEHCGRVCGKALAFIRAGEGRDGPDRRPATCSQVTAGGARERPWQRMNKVPSARGDLADHGVGDFAGPTRTSNGDLPTRQAS